MTKELIIFDLDGTLLNTIPDLAASTNYALSALGFPTRAEHEIKSFVGDGIDMLFRRALPKEHSNNENVLKMHNIFVKHYAIHNADFTKPYDGIIDTVKKLNDKGIKTAVASNKYHDGAIAVINRFFPAVKFDSVYGLRDGYKPKPNPAIVYDILRDCNIKDKTKVLYVGDSVTDIMTAKNAEVDVAAATWGYRSVEELSKAEPEYIIDSPHLILDIIE